MTLIHFLIASSCFKRHWPQGCQAEYTESIWPSHIGVTFCRSYLSSISRETSGTAHIFTMHILQPLGHYCWNTDNSLLKGMLQSTYFLHFCKFSRTVTLSWWPIHLFGNLLTKQTVKWVSEIRKCICTGGKRISSTFWAERWDGSFLFRWVSILSRYLSCWG